MNRLDFARYVLCELCVISVHSRLITAAMYFIDLGYRLILEKRWIRIISVQTNLKPNAEKFWKNCRLV